MAEMIRSHHKKILSVLSVMDAKKLADLGIYFGGGTAISMLLGEFRTSVDIDFLCASHEGYAQLRGMIFNDSLTPLFMPGFAPELAREVKADRDGVRAILLVDDTPIKFEIVREARINLEQGETWLPVPTLSNTSLFAEKLLCNADRGLDKSTRAKDVIDLLMMEHHWGFDRVARDMNAMLTGAETIKAVRFEENPSPDQGGRP